VQPEGQAHAYESVGGRKRGYEGAGFSVRFSVVVAAFNAEDTLEGAVHSVLDQPGSDFEVIVSDDGSTDATLALARRLADEDVRVHVVAGPNGGCSAARNRGFERASGEFGILLDADDEFAPEYFTTMRTFIDQRPGMDIYSTNGIRRLPDGTDEPFFRGTAYSTETTWTLSDLIPVDCIFLMAAIRRGLWESLGGCRTDLRYAEDYDFWLRALASGARHIYRPDRLGIAISRATSKSKNRIPHAEAQIRIFEDLGRRPELTDEQRGACERKIADLRTRIERVKLESRLQEGDVRGARRAYLRVRSAYLSQPLYFAGLALMLLSPRLYTAAFASRNARRSGL
jgi:GT2 family glycosyltransferase